MRASCHCHVHCLLLIVGASLYLAESFSDLTDRQAHAAPKARQKSGQSGREVFRHDTFGDEQLWTDQLRLHEVIESAVSPEAALGVGLKVDVDALPRKVQQAIKNGQVDLGDPQTTLQLLKLGAVVGVEGQVVEIGGGQLSLKSVGITCALCHSTVDDSFDPGIGRRLDGWPNLDLDPGAIIALSPAISGAARDVYLRSIARPTVSGAAGCHNAGANRIPCHSPLRILELSPHHFGGCGWQASVVESQRL